jgi:signal recognition particle subunit SRP54
LLVAGDIYRPAAIKQLEVLGEAAGIPVFSLGDKASPRDIAKAALAHAAKNGNDQVIIDTAGRLHINEALMAELAELVKITSPKEVLLVIDAMAGQDAVNQAAAFHAELAVSGIVLTKLDGDTRGGAALSVKAVTGCPIKFTGTGEKLQALEPFYPERMASRILGMGDVLTLIERAEASMDAAKLKDMEAKMRTARFTFDDFLDQLAQIRNMGDINEVMGMIPGMGKQLKNIQLDDRQFVAVESIIHSMTAAERANPALINGSRKRRIALGCGRQVQDVNRLLNQFEQMQKMMKQMSNMPGGTGKKAKKGKKMPFQLPF